MPKGKPALSAADVKSLRDWIDEGMPWEAGFTFATREYEPPLRPRRPELPIAVAGRENAVDRILDAYLAKHHVARPAQLDDAAFFASRLSRHRWHAADARSAADVCLRAVIRINGSRRSTSCWPTTTVMLSIGCRFGTICCVMTTPERVISMVGGSPSARGCIARSWRTCRMTSLSGS